MTGKIKAERSSIATENEQKLVEKLEKPENDHQQEKRKIIKNVLLISVAFLLLFTGFQGLIRLQSSLHMVEGMGVINAGVQFLANIIACLLLPKVLTAKLGHKWTITLCLSAFILWMAANGYAVWGTMGPASVLVGAAAGPLWAAQGSYFTIISRQYSKITGESVQSTLTKFFGIIMAFYQFTGITGSILSSFILQTKPVNVTLNPEDPVLQTCGANDCPYLNTTNPNLEKPSQVVVWTLLGVYILLAICAPLIVAFLVDDLPKEPRSKEKSSCDELSKFLLATLSLFKNKDAVLLFPLAVYSGVETVFYGAEFSKSYVSCSLGIWMVGYVTLPFGLSSTFASFGSARLAKYTGQIPLFMSALVVDLCIQATLMFWMPRPDQAWVLLLLSGLWGYTDGIWQTHIPAVYGVVFPGNTEAAFASRVGGYSIGCMIAFSYSFFLCTTTKLVILTVVLVIGMAGYMTVEIPRLRNKTYTGIALEEKTVDV